jgi:hypothetical protein
MPSRRSSRSVRSCATAAAGLAARRVGPAGELAAMKRASSWGRKITRPVRGHPEAVSTVLEVVAEILPDVLQNLLP